MGLMNFIEMLESWMTTGECGPGDGDFCPECWTNYLESVDDEEMQDAINDARPTAEIAEFRKVNNPDFIGWSTFCSECHKVIHEPMWDLSKTRIWISEPQGICRNYGDNCYVFIW